ncbi:hypothetical protein [Inovirus sp.]|nr:hypothetical protein [Inovirus sp.]
MYKKLLALSLALVLCICPVAAVSDADNSYYSFEPVSYGSLGGRSLATLAATSGWTDTDHDYLNQIRLALTSKNTGTLLSYVISIKDLVDKSFDKLFYIKQNTDYLQNINNNGNSILTYLRNDINGPIVRELLTAIKDNTHDISSAWTPEQSASVTFASDKYYAIWTADWVPHFAGSNPDPTLRVGLQQTLGFLASTFLYDSDTFWNGYDPSFYSLVHRLQKTLASDEDMALAEAQKSNRQQIEQDFVSGSSGNTSLGASDFGDLSSVGGSVKDSISLNGQSSISGFTGGLSDANEAGQGWFSASTRDALDTVSSFSSSFSRARRAPDDTYNMAGFSEHYSWLYGG